MRFKWVASVALISVMGMVALLTLGAQRPTRSDKAKERGNVFVEALREPIPHVGMIHQWMFAGPVQLTGAQSLDADGQVTNGDVFLQVVGSGVVIGSDSKSRIVKDGDTPFLGDVIVGGIIQNTGDTAVRLSFGKEGQVTLAPGQNLYVGSAEHLLRDAAPSSFGPTSPRREPLHDRSTPLKRLGSGDLLSQGPGTHCFVCECTCEYTGGSCTITVDATLTTDCSLANAVSCDCKVGDRTRRGTTGGCERRLVECKK